MPVGAPRAAAILSTLVLSVILGILIGAFVSAMLFLMNLGIRAVWTTVPQSGSVWLLPLVICPIGGLVIGWWNHRFHAAPEELEKVLAQVKATGTYRVGNVPAALVAFLLPLIFGGAVGPEAGLTGFIAAGATRVSATLKRAGLRVLSLADTTVSATICAVFGAPFGGFVLATESMPEGTSDERLFTYRRAVKIVLYAVCAGGAFLGMWLVSLVLGRNGGLPRFEGAGVPIPDGLWQILVCIAAGYILALVFGASRKGCSALAGKLVGHDIVMGFIVGIVLAVLGAFLPAVLFSGEDQMRDLADLARTLPAIVLVITAFVKCAVTPLCIELGWKGGSIFPCIFSGSALGFGIAALIGADPLFCAACTCAAFMGAKMGRPVFAAALLLLCFPASSLVWLIVAAVAGAFIPCPRIMRGDMKERPIRRKRSS